MPTINTTMDKLASDAVFAFGHNRTPTSALLVKCSNNYAYSLDDPKKIKWPNTSRYTTKDAVANQLVTFFGVANSYERSNHP